MISKEMSAAMDKPSSIEPTLIKQMEDYYIALFRSLAQSLDIITWREIRGAALYQLQLSPSSVIAMLNDREDFHADFEQIGYQPEKRVYQREQHTHLAWEVTRGYRREQLGLPREDNTEVQR